MAVLGCRSPLLVIIIIIIIIISLMGVALSLIRVVDNNPLRVS